MKAPVIPAKKFQEEVNLLPDSFFLIDVRDDWEYDEHPHVKKRLSVYDFPDHLEDLKKFDDKKMVLCCRTGVRGNVGAKYLLQNGFKNVYNLEGGFEALTALKEAQK